MDRQALDTGPSPQKDADPAGSGSTILFFGDKGTWNVVNVDYRLLSARFPT
jgi:hypothetical protein